MNDSLVKHMNAQRQNREREKIGEKEKKGKMSLSNKLTKIYRRLICVRAPMQTLSVMALDSWRVKNQLHFSIK